MWGLMINEFQKIMKNKKYMIIVILFAALLSLFSYMFYRTTQNESVENMIGWNTSQLKNYQTEMKDKGISEERKKQLEKRIEEVTTTLEELQMEKDLEKEDWKTLLNKQIEQLNSEKEKIPVFSDNTRVEQIDSQIREKEYNLKHDTRPTGNNSNAYSILLMSILAIGSLFLSAGIAAFMADVVSKEYTNPTIKILLTKPVSRAKILLSKYIVSVITSVGLVVIIEMIIFLIIGFLIGFGNPSEAAAAGTRFVYDTLNPVPGGYALTAILGSTQVLPVWLLFLQVIGLECIYIIACVSFCFLLSTVTRNSMAAMTGGIIFTIALNIFVTVLMVSGGSDSAIIQKIVPLLFTTYGNVVQLAGLDGGLSQALKNPLLTPAFGIGVCMVWTVVCYAVSHVVFVKRDNLA